MYLYPAYRGRPVEATGALLPVAIFEHTMEYFLDSVPEVTAQECVQQRIHSRVEVGEQESERSKQRVEIRVPDIVLRPNDRRDTQFG